MKHTFVGTYNGVMDGPVSWPFRWTAPTDLDNVVFYVAGNAADANESSDGDYVYTLTTTLARGDSTPVEDSSWSRIKSLY